MTAPVRLGLIGLGHWGRICLRTLSQDFPLGQVTALASGSAKAGDFSVPLFSAWQDLLHSGLCDGVIITTPAHTHVPIAEAAARCGIAVFVEKPLCTDPAEAAGFASMLRDHRVPVLVDHIHLFNPAFQTLLSLRSGLGPVLGIEAVAGKPVPAHPDLPVLWDWGAHDVAMCLRLMGRLPDGVAARTLGRPSFADGPGQIVDLDLAFGDVAAHLRLGSLPQRQRLMTVRCQDGVVVYDDTQPENKLTVNGHPHTVPLDPPLRLALMEFCRRVRSWTTLSDDVDLAVQVVEVLARAQNHLQD